MSIRFMAAFFLAFLLSLSARAQVLPSRYDALAWRCIGPYRGGRTVGADGIISQPNVLFIGVNNGGVWKTTDYGLTWKPIFDDQPTGSVGCLAVAQSRPDTIYVGSGEGLQRPDLSVGDGVYKTIDGGKTWTNTGLKDGWQISDICVDPTNPDRVFVAVLGHPYGPNETRGLFRTLDGGKSWKKVLYKDANTGAVAVELDPANPENRLLLALVGAASALGERARGRGKPAACSSPSTAEAPGSPSRKVCRRSNRDSDESGSRYSTRSVFMPRSTRRRTAESTAPTTAEAPGFTRTPS